MSPVEILHTGHFAYIFFFFMGMLQGSWKHCWELVPTAPLFFFFRKNVRWWFLYCMIRAEIPHSLVLSVSTCAPQWLVWSFVAVLFLCPVLLPLCSFVQLCRGKSYKSIFLVFSYHVCRNTVVLRSRNFATMATWHNCLSSLSTFSRF